MGQREELAPEGRHQSEQLLGSLATFLERVEHDDLASHVGLVEQGRGELAPALVLVGEDALVCHAR